MDFARTVLSTFALASKIPLKQRVTGYMADHGTVHCSAGQSRSAEFFLKFSTFLMDDMIERSAMVCFSLRTAMPWLRDGRPWDDGRMGGCKVYIASTGGHWPQDDHYSAAGDRVRGADHVPLFAMSPRVTKMDNRSVRAVLCSMGDKQRGDWEWRCRSREKAGTEAPCRPILAQSWPRHEFYSLRSARAARVSTCGRTRCAQYLWSSRTGMCDSNLADFSHFQAES